jgi:hypothetical protein
LIVGRSVAIFRLVCVAAGIAAGVTFPATAGALSAPEVFYAEGDVSSYEGNVPQSLWLPLAGADAATLSPTIGVRLQDSQSTGTAHPFKIEALSVPDGRPSQDPFYWGGGCIFASGPIGQIGELQQLQYEGPGTYTIRVTAFNESDISATHCASGGVAQVVSFRIDGRPTLRFSAPTLLAGGPARDPHGQEIGLIETLPPLASSQQTVCALDGRVAADGSVSGSRSFADPADGTSQDLFPAAGKWTCVARAFAGVSHPPPGDSDPTRATAWSAPASAFFRTDVSLVSLRIADASSPHFALAGKVNRAAAGGVLTLHITRTRGCPRAEGWIVPAQDAPRGQTVPTRQARPRAVASDCVLLGQSSGPTGRAIRRAVYGPLGRLRARHRLPEATRRTAPEALHRRHLRRLRLASIHPRQRSRTRPRRVKANSHPSLSPRPRGKRAPS